jgi:hypothetical protein
LAKWWTSTGEKDDFGRATDRISDAGIPTAIFSAWYFVASTHGFTGPWRIIMALDELVGSPAVESAQWYLTVAQGTAIGFATASPVLFVDYIKNDYDGGYRPASAPMPLDKWFEVKAVVREGVRIDWYLNGTLFDSSSGAVNPVGRSRGLTSGYAFVIEHGKGTGWWLATDVSVRALPR